MRLLATSIPPPRPTAERVPVAQVPVAPSRVTSGDRVIVLDEEVTELGVDNRLRAEAVRLLAELAR